MTATLRFTALSLSLLLAAPLVRAQVRFGVGPQVGLTISSARYSRGSGYLGTSSALYRNGVQAGLVGSLEAGHFALQPALLYCQEGYLIRNEYAGAPAGSTTINNDVRLDYLTIPVNLAYVFRANGQGVRLFAGGYASFLVGGHQIVSSSTMRGENDVMASDEYKGPGSYYSRGIDAGLQAGVGSRIKQFLLQADYSFGLRDTYVGSMNTGMFTTSTYNRSFHLSVGYLFGLDD